MAVNFAELIADTRETCSERAQDVELGSEEWKAYSAIVTIIDHSSGDLETRAGFIARSLTVLTHTSNHGAMEREILNVYTDAFNSVAGKPLARMIR